MAMPIDKKFKVTAEYHNEEPSETICETFEELTGTLECIYALLSEFVKTVTITPVKCATMQSMNCTAANIGLLMVSCWLVAMLKGINNDISN